MKKPLAFFVFIMFHLFVQGQEFLEHTIHLYGSPTLFNFHKSVTLQIDLIPGNDEITNPFIVAEGFDPGGITNPDVAFGDTNIAHFLTLNSSIPNSGNQLRNLLDFDASQEYDIIYINWNNGTGDIRENSDLLEKVLNWVNNQKTTNEPNVLLGQSMGGVIGRYTLARMEQEDPDFNPNDPATSPHEVRLFIAHDSPLQGSNTPISTQHFSRHMLNFYIETPIAYFIGENALPAIYGIAELGSSIINLFGGNTTVDPYVSPESYLTIQDSPAAVQMNYWWVDYHEDATTSVHDAWQQQFEAMGYPQASRNIAISNGNECAVGHGFTPGELLVEIDDLDNPDVFGDIVHMLGTFIGGALNGNIGLAILGILPGSSKWYYDFDLRATPSGGQQVYYGRVRYEKKLLWLIKTTINVTHRNIDAPNGILPYGTYSGGEFDIENVLAELPSQLPPVIVHNRFYGFIPVVSALDIQKAFGSIQPSDYTRSYSGGNINESYLSTSFDNFLVDFTHGANNEHITFQTRNGNWLATELNGNNGEIPDCSIVCDNGMLKIRGLSQLCNTADYSIDDLPSNLTLVWDVSPSGAFNNVVINNNSVTLTPSGFFNGEATLTAAISGTCGGNLVDVEVEKKIYIGAQRPKLIDDFGGEIVHIEACTNLHHDLSFTTPPGAFEWEWRKISGNFTLVHNNNNSGTIIGFQETSGIIDVRVRDNCGWSPRTMITIDISSDCSGSGGLEPFSVAPNPADDVLVISQNSEANIGATTLGTSTATVGEDQVLDSTATLYDLNGVPVATQTPATGTMNVEGLSPDHYILVISCGGESESHHIIIN